MGAANSAPSAEAEAFASSYAELPDDVHDIVEALCDKDSAALLKPNLAAPAPFPPTLCAQSLSPLSLSRAAARRLSPRRRPWI